MQKVLVFTDRPSPRLLYVLHFLQNALSGSQWEMVHTLDVYRKHLGPSIAYGTEALKNNELRIPRVPYSDETLSVLKDRLPSIENDCFSKNFANQELDLFSAIFWQLTRLEEYFPSPLDIHQRYMAQNSMLYRHGRLKIPVVDQWVSMISDRFQKELGVVLKSPATKLEWSIGVDVDQFFKYAHKSLVKQVGGALRDLKNGELSNLKQRLRTSLGIQKDVFDQFENLLRMGIPKQQLIFFILSNGSTQFDKNHSLRLRPVQKLLKAMQSASMLAIHPSYNAACDPQTLEKDIRAWSKAFMEKPERSRQHFVRLKWPDTYRMLEAQGIQHDFSMGYPEMPGFRAGTSRCFHWYDIEKEMETNLLVHPFVAMDRTYLSYLKWAPEKSLNDLKEWAEVIRENGGQMHVIWHNSSFDFDGEWSGWQGIFESWVDFLLQQDSMGEVGPRSM